MPQITSITLHLQTGTRSGSGTDGDVYLGVCGREFSIYSEKGDFESGQGRAYVLGEGATVRNAEVNDLRGTNSFSPRMFIISRFISGSNLGAGQTTGNCSAPMSDLMSRFISTGTRLMLWSTSPRRVFGAACGRAFSSTSRTCLTGLRQASKLPKTQPCTVSWRFCDASENSQNSELNRKESERRPDSLFFALSKSL